MDERLLLATLEVAEGREDDYRAWHDAHIRELLEHVDGIVGGRRYELTELELLPGAFPTARFAAIYVLDRDSSEVRRNLEQARGAGLITPPPAGVVLGGLSLAYEAA